MSSDFGKLQQQATGTEPDRDCFAVPAILRGGRFIPKAGPGSRAYAMVYHPETGEKISSHRLGKPHDWWEWSPDIDAWVATRGAELTGDGLVLVDCDVPLLPDGSPEVDGFKRLMDFATEAGRYPDANEWLMVRTPGHQEPGKPPKGPCWHIWFRDDPEFPVKTGALKRCRAIEFKRQGTCPGSPGYAVRHCPEGDELPVMPRWLVELAGMATPGDTTTGYVGFSELGDGQRAWSEFMKEKARAKAEDATIDGNSGGSGSGPDPDDGYSAHHEYLKATRKEWHRADREALQELDEESAIVRPEPPDDAFFSTLTADLAAPVEEQRWLIDRLVGAYHNVVMAALFKAGKTTTAINFAAVLAEAIAEEKKEFLGRKVNPPEGGISFWNLEVHRADFNESYTGALGCTATERIRTAHLRDYPVPLLKDGEARKLALKHLDGADVWFIDTWGRFCAWHNVDPLDNHGVGILLARLDEFKLEAGIKCVVISAHMPHAARENRVFERALGAQAFSGWADTLITVSLDGDGGRFISATGRGAELAETALIMADGTSRITTTGQNRTQFAQSRLDWQVATVIRSNPGITTKDLRDGIDGRNEDIAHAVIRLIGNGSIRREPPNPRRGQTVRYYPVDKVVP